VGMAAFALLGVSATTAVLAKVVLSRRIDQAPPAGEAPDTDKLNGVLVEINDRIDKLTLAVSDGIERVSRAENRIQKSVTSARRLVREAGLEHAGIEAEFAELQPADDPGIEPLPAMPAGVDQGREVRIPGGHLTIGAA